MLTLRKAQDRGHANHGWLDSRHTFSFGEYHDPAHMGFGPLRVINDDRVAGGGGFPTHAHADMEIVTYVLEGALEHKDSLGTGSIIRPGDVQRMSAGTGIRHSEYNASKTEPVHFLQIWVLPEKHGLAPGYEQKTLPLTQMKDSLHLIGSQDGRQGSVTVHQDVAIYAGRLTKGGCVTYSLQSGRAVWLQVASGIATINGTAVSAGDGVAVSQAFAIKIVGASDLSEILVFDVAA